MKFRLFFTVTTGLFAIIFSNSGAFAQTGNVGIGTTSPQARLHVADSGVVFTGPATVPLTTLFAPPVSGAGTRLMWYPQKAAFRVGNVNNLSWDKDSIGLYSFANGFNNKAKGSFSTSMGEGTTASGFASTSMGAFTRASGDNSTSMGNRTTASGGNSTSMGDGTTASGFNSTSMGDGTTASGFYSTSMGELTTASGFASTSMGNRTTASGDNSTSMGQTTSARGFNSTSMGQGTFAIGVASTSMGLFTRASGDNSTSMGTITRASGDNSTSMGEGTTARAYASVALGRFNDSIATSSTITSVLTDPLFIIGNGTSNTSRSNALTILKNGNTGFNIIDPQARMHITRTTASGALVNSSATMLIDENNGALIQFLSNSGSLSGIVCGTEKTTLRSGILFPGDSSISFRSGGNNTKMTLEANGNVGIGTSTPNALLQLGNTVANRKIVLYETANNDHQYYGFGINGATLRYQTDAAAADHVFFAAVSSTSSQELMRIKGNGNVGIGTNAPSQKLHVIGNILASGTITPSDLRYKKDIELIDHPLEKIEEIRGVTYKLKSDEFPESGFSNEIQTGVIAQEVEAVLPQVVVTDPNGYKAVDYSKMVPLLIEGIKELKQITEQLKDENEKVKKENADLKKRIEKLEKK